MRDYLLILLREYGFRNVVMVATGKGLTRIIKWFPFIIEKYFYIYVDWCVRCVFEMKAKTNIAKTFPQFPYSYHLTVLYV